MRRRKVLLAVPWGLALAVAILSIWLGSEDILAYVRNLLYPLTVGIVGTLIVFRQPRNPVGWPFLVSFVFVTLHDLFNLAVQVSMNLPDQVAVYSDSFVAFFDAYLDGPVSIALWGTLFMFPVLYFPNGNLVSPRWRYVVGVILMQLLALLVVGIFYPGLESPLFPDFQNPLSRPLADPIWDGVNGTLLITFILAPLSLVIRFRSATGVERQQIKWPLFSASIIFISVVLYLLAAAISGGVLVQDNPVARVALTFELISVLSFPIAVGVAILRYRLYDIDLIIRRTLVYGALTLTLALVYYASVLLLQNLLQTFTGQGQSPLVLVVSTLLIAALFTPVRRRIQGAIDRRFYRRRYDAAQTLEVFAAGLRHEVDLEQISQRLLDAASETMQPAHASLWLKEK